MLLMQKENMFIPVLFLPVSNLGLVEISAVSASTDVQRDW